MLNIITGRTGSGKTRYIRNLAAEIAKEASGKAVIIVPEQFSFETERAMLTILGNEKINNVEVLSFSRITERLLSDYGKLSKKTADDGTRAVLMSLAIETLEDKLSAFNRYRKSPALIGNLLDFYREMKKCCINAGALAELSEKVKKQSFAKKLNELSLIFECYDALITQNFQDDCSYLDLLYDLLGEVEYFNGKTVFADAFSGFSAQEYKILERILSQADEVFVTFCCDTSKNNDRYELFYNAQTEIKKLKATARRANVKIAPEKVLYANREYKAEPLNVLEENIFTSNGMKYTENADCITLMPRRSKTDECDAVAAEIKRLVREENYRYRDIAVIERSEGEYKNELVSSFRKYGVACYEDNRQPILTQPLMVFVLALFDILVDGLQTETVLRFLKTGLFGFTIEEIAMIEDYALVWRISPSQWRNEWTGNPRGFGVEFTDNDEKTLENINKLREKIVAPILALKKRMTDTNGETISRELFTFLRTCGVDENLKNFVSVLENNGETDLALEQGRIWRILAGIIDSLYSATGKSAMTVARYKELFEILVSTKDLGQIPNGIDEVILGSADRIRAAAPKAVFIVGANTGVFPMESSGGVLLSDTERCELIENGAELVTNLEYNSVSERFIAYHALTLATEKLYVSYSAIDTSSATLTPSEIVGEIMSIFPKCRIYNDCAVNKIESRKSAYTAFAEEKDTSSVLGATLYEYFKNKGTATELSMLQKINKKEFGIENKELATELFGKSMYISASKTERFYKCPFGYFCKYGIKAKPRREAEMDPAQTGTLVHYALERFLRENSKEEFTHFKQDTVREKVNEIIDDYVCEMLGGYSEKDASFIRTINLIKENTLRIVLHLVDEFSQSRFVPVDFELSINNDGDIAPYLINLENGGTVKIIGSVDRVDAYKTEENTFIRVIDYKTGVKDFKLGEVFEGLNMQMLIYLFAIWQNGGDRYDNVLPAGILYFHAKSPRMTSSALPRTADASAVKHKMYQDSKMSGMVLNNIEVIDAMEKDGANVFIPAKLDKSGNAAGNVISIKKLEALRDKVNGNIRKMAEALQSGEINALPTEKGCDHCDYRDVCKREEDDEIREIENIGFKDALNMLGGDSDE